MIVGPPSLKGRPLLVKLYYHKIELLSVFFTILLVIAFYLMAREIRENRRRDVVLAQQTTQLRMLLQAQTQFSRFLIDNNGQSIGQLRQYIIAQDRANQAEIRRLESALRFAGITLPPQSVLEWQPPGSTSMPSPSFIPSVTPLPTPPDQRQPNGQSVRGHSFPNVCIIGICLFGDT